MTIDAQPTTALRLVPMISCTDVNAALTLYRDELGFVVTDKYEDNGRLVWCLAKAGTTDVMFQHHPQQATRNGGTVFWVYVNDVDTLRTHLVNKGYEVSQPETSGGRRECEMSDPDGNPVMLCQVKS